MRAAERAYAAQYGPAQWIRSADQHLELVQSFEVRDPIWAHSVMAAHMHAGRATDLRSRVARRAARDI